MYRSKTGPGFPSMLTHTMGLDRFFSGCLHRACGQILNHKYICPVCPEHCVDEALAGLAKNDRLDVFPNLMKSTGVLERGDTLFT